MRVKLAFGASGLWLELPDGWPVTVLEPLFAEALPDPAGALRAALRRPMGAAALRDSVRSSDRVGVVFSDITRPTPHQLLLPAILGEIAHVPAEQITLFNALGTHRPNSRAELASMIGGELLARHRIVQNDAFDAETQVYLGRTARGHEIWINRDVIACDVLILTGFIEPHFFAGFSGGAKALMPGMAGQKSVLGNHDASMIAHPSATWGVTEGNPVWEEIMEVARIVSSSHSGVRSIFLTNVTLNRDRQVTGIFAGELREAHAAGCRFARETAMVGTPDPFDVVITTNSGYPLDLNLYQAVKGMSAAAQIVREGGSIIVAAECRDGIPEHGLYGQLLRRATNPRELLEMVLAPGFPAQDQWQVQIQAQIQLKADVYVHSSHLSDEQIRAALLKPCHDITETAGSLMTRLGHGATICVLPEGPQTIPFLAR